jgi:hypothetical protein
MPGITITKGISFESPGTYRIRIKGHLDDTHSAQLGGMVVTRAFTADQEPITVLIGHLQDQAALSSVLSELYELHRPLLTLELLGAPA